MADKRNISFMDPMCLQDLQARNIPLSRENILEYFSMSPFYDSQSNNEAIRAQGVSAIHLKGMKGLEFEVEPTQDEPKLFVIKKQKRSSPTSADILEVYYVLDGTIYQSPSLLDILNVRYSDICHYLHQAFQVALDDLQYTPRGRTCLQHTSVQEKQKLVTQRQIPEMPSFTAIIDDIEAMIPKE